MATTEKRTAAVDMLVSKGIWKSNAAPPVFRGLWALGFDTPPPHFSSFWGNALKMGSFFGATWGLGMWFFLWRDQGLAISGVALAVVTSGILFGFAMAFYYDYGKRKYKLPSWDKLKA
jgi:Family of unknown function (DUF6404)